MCKIKPYSDQIHHYLDSVMLRIDTYLFPEDLESMLKKLQEIFNGRPSEISFDEINMQIIDIDSVSDLQNSFINNILESKKIYLLNNANSFGIMQDIYLNKFFIAFNVKGPIESIEKSIMAIQDAFSSLAKIDASYCYLRLNYSLVHVDKDEVWSICDRSAFPIMEGLGYDGQYTDSIQIDDFFIDLSRSIYNNKNDNDVDVNIQTKLIFSTSSLQEVSEKIGKAVDLSKNEISRCFNS